jgi:hypothetical protein
VDAALTADAEDRHDIRVVQLGRCLRFVLETLQLLGIQGGGKRQHLQRHAAAERDLHRFINHAHAAAADFPNDAEISQWPFRLDFWQRRRHLPRTSLIQLRRDSVHELQTVQTLGQGPRDRRKARQELLPLGRRPGLQTGEILLHRPDHACVVQGYGWSV